MKWVDVEIRENKMGKNAPYASVGFGRVSLSSSACELICGFSKYKYAKFMKPQNGTFCVGVKFLEDYQENSIKIAKRKHEKKIVENSCYLTNKLVIKELFGNKGVNNKIERYSVRLDEEDKTIIVIYK